MCSWPCGTRARTSNFWSVEGNVLIERRWSRQIVNKLRNASARLGTDHALPVDVVWRENRSDHFVGRECSLLEPCSPRLGTRAAEWLRRSRSAERPKASASRSTHRPFPHLGFATSGWFFRLTHATLALSSTCRRTFSVKVHGDLPRVD